MKLERREKILAVVAATLASAFAVWVLYFSGSGFSYDQLDARCKQLVAQVDKKEAQVKAAGVAARRLAEWQRRALPSNTSDARTVYQAWLRRLAAQCQINQLNVDSAGGRSQKDIFTLFTFSVRGRTNIAKLIEFLHAFQSAGHLHQIRRLELKSVENSPELDVGVTVEAMSLPGADRKSELTKMPADKPRLFPLADYARTISERNVFGPYRSVSDAAQTTFVTAILESAGRREVWLSDRTSGQQWKLHEDEFFQIGLLQGKVKTIGTRDVILELSEKLRRFRCGDSLRGGEEMKESKTVGKP